MIQRSIVLAIALITTLSVNSQELDEGKRIRLTQAVEQNVNGISPGLAVGIVVNGDIVYEEYRGYSNLENRTEINKSTRFNIASNAKQYTALCILQLAENDSLTLSDDIRKYLPELYNDIDETITISQLISHTSGIRDVHYLWSLKGQTWWKLFVGNDDAIELITNQTDLNFKPGTEYLYSNSNYILLAEIVERVSGKNFGEYALGFFEAQQMKETAFLTNNMAVVPNRARPYGNWNGWIEYPYITEIHGDGGLFTTLRDQLQWEKIVQDNDGDNISTTILSASQARIPGVSTTEYGHGLMFAVYKGLEYSYHDGSTGAYSATFLRFPKEKTSIVVVSNSGKVSSNSLAKQLADITLNLNEEMREYPAGPEEIQKLASLESITGNYLTQDNTLIKIVEKEGALYREIYQRDPVRLIQEDEGLFYYETFEDLKMNFTKDENGNASFTIYLSSQPPNTGTKLPDFTGDTTHDSNFDGSYYNDETDTRVSIKHVEDTFYSITKDGKELAAELLLKDVLRMDSYEIKFRRNKKGRVDGLLVENGRIKNVFFRKI
ncbi:MAG: hypothetical protein Aureis2KO_14790 [Aureisphaera sp.]